MNRSFTNILIKCILLSATCICIAQSNAGSIPLLNPGFEEDVNQNGYPNDWIPGLGLIYDAEGEEAHSGVAAILTNTPSRVIQEHQPEPVGALTLRSWMRARPDEGQQGFMEVLFYRDRTFLGADGDRFDLTNEYDRFGVNALLPPDSDRYLIVLRSTSSKTWVWIDDVDLLTDRIDNGDMEVISNGAPTGWDAVGMPTLDMLGGASPRSPTAVVCDSDNYFFQSISCLPTSRTYTLQFMVKSPAGAVSDSVHVAWFDKKGQNFEQSQIAFDADEAYREVMGEFVAPEGAVWGEVGLQPNGETWLWFDDVWLGWQTTAPGWITPNEDNINDVSILYYYLPVDAITTLTVVNESDEIVESVIAGTPQPSGIYSAVFNGRTFPSGIAGGGDDVVLTAGTYRFRIQTLDVNGVALQSDRPVVLRESQAWPPRINDSTDDTFVIGLWEFVFGNEFATYSSYADLVQSAARDHFNTVVMLWLRDEDSDEAYDAILDSTIQAITHNFFLQFVIDDWAFPGAFDEPLMAELLLDLTARYGGNPNWLSIYLKDEPPLFLAEPLRAGFRMTENLAPDQLPLSTFSTNPDAEFLTQQVMPSVLMFDLYPVTAAQTLGAAQWDGFITGLELMNSVAMQAGRPFWLVAQGFLNSSGRRPLLPAEQRAIVGLTIAHGARGISYFIRSTFSGNEGLLDNKFNPTRMMVEVAAQNKRLSALGQLLVDLQEISFEFTIEDEACFGRAFEDSKGRTVIIVVNRDTMIARTPVIMVEGAAAQSAAEEVRGDTDEIQILPLPSQHRDGDLIVHLPALAPGDWTIVRIASEFN